MKTLIILTILIYIWGKTQAETPSLDKAVSETLMQLHTAGSSDELYACVAKMERIAAAAPDRWELLYHLAYCRINTSFRESNGKLKDDILDHAEQEINSALNLGGNKSELLALQAYLYQGRIQVNASRGMKYSRMAAETLEQAIALDANNPRAHFLMGQNVFHTPKMFGGGPKNALPHFHRAMECYTASKQTNLLSPAWGKEITLQMISACENN